MDTLRRAAYTRPFHALPAQWVGRGSVNDPVEMNSCGHLWNTAGVLSREVAKKVVISTGP